VTHSAGRINFEEGADLDARGVLRPSYSNARKRLEYFESTFPEKFAFSRTERVNRILGENLTFCLEHH